MGFSFFGKALFLALYYISESSGDTFNKLKNILVRRLKMNTKTQNILKIVGVVFAAFVLAAVTGLFVWSQIGKADIQIQLDTATAELTTVSAALDDAKVEGDNLNGKINTLTTQRNGYQKAINDANGKLTEILNKCSGGVPMTQEDADEIEALNNTIAVLNVEVERLTAELEAAENYRDALEAWRLECPCLFVVKVDESGDFCKDENGDYIIKDVAFKPGEGLISLAEWIMHMPKCEEFYPSIEEDPAEDVNDEQTVVVDNSGNKIN